MKLTVTNATRVTLPDGAPAWMVRFSVEREPGGGSFHYRISETADAYYHCFPESTLEWRVAEYGLDPGDRDVLMDVILSEPFLDDQDGEPRLGSNAPASVIREAHLRRCAKAKLAVRMSTRGIRNPIEMVRNAPIDLGGVEAKKREVDLMLSGRERNPRG